MSLFHSDVYFQRMNLREQDISVVESKVHLDTSVQVLGTCPLNIQFIYLTALVTSYFQDEYFTQ